MRSTTPLISYTKMLFKKVLKGVKKFILSTVGVYGLTSALKSVNIKSELAPNFLFEVEIRCRKLFVGKIIIIWC